MGFILQQLLGILALGVALEGYLLTDVNMFFRVMTGAAALTLVVPNVLTDVIGLSLIAILIVTQIALLKRNKHSLA